MFNLESAFAWISTKAEQVRQINTIHEDNSVGFLRAHLPFSICQLQIVTAYLTPICREVTVFGLHGIPLAGPIRPRGVCWYSQLWWAPDDWRSRALRAWLQSPKSQSSNSSVLGSLQSKGMCTSRSRRQFCTCAVFSLLKCLCCRSAACLSGQLLWRGTVHPSETRCQAKGHTCAVMNFSDIPLGTCKKHDSTQWVICLIYAWHLFPKGKLHATCLHYIVCGLPDITPACACWTSHSKYAAAITTLLVRLSTR